MPRGCLQFVILVFPDHTHVLILDPEIRLDQDPNCLKTSPLAREEIRVDNKMETSRLYL